MGGWVGGWVGESKGAEARVPQPPDDGSVRAHGALSSVEFVSFLFFHFFWFIFFLEGCNVINCIPRSDRVP